MPKRTMIQLYFASGDCDEAMKLYQEAFGGKLLNMIRADDGDKFHEPGEIIHAEMEIFGQIFTFSEIVYTAEELVRGNGTEFWFELEKGQIDAGRKAYDILKEDAKEIPKFNAGSGEGFWDEWCFCVTDKYGIIWGLFC